MSDAQPNRMSFMGALALAVTPVVVASAVGSWATLPSIPTWYASLSKPWFNPPNWIFGPVWTLLYTVMAYAFFRILRQPVTGGRGLVIAAFLIQIACNAGWSIAFFGGRSAALGLLVVVPLCLSVAWTMVLFWRRDRFSGAAFAPYLAWVTFAAILNFAIWRLNG